MGIRNLYLRVTYPPLTLIMTLQEEHKMLGEWFLIDSSLKVRFSSYLKQFLVGEK